MKVKRESSRLVKPCYEEGITPPNTLTVVPLSVFDTATYNTHIAVIYAYRPPTPPNSKVEKGLARVLSEYREWGGRLGKDGEGKPAILLNDEGVRFVEASVDCTLEKAMPLRPSPALLSLHPDLHRVEELVQVQLTRFTCGSLVVGFTSHHVVADGHSTSSFLVAWGKATRCLPLDPLPLHGRSAFFLPRDPPRIEFEHRGVEFKSGKSWPSPTAAQRRRRKTEVTGPSRRRTMSSSTRRISRWTSSPSSRRGPPPVREAAGDATARSRA